MIYGLGMQELLVILAIVMLLFGGKKLPEVGRNLGKAIRGFKESEEETRKELQKVAEGGGDEGAEDEKDPSTPGQNSEQADSGQTGRETAEAVETAEKKVEEKSEEEKQPEA